MRKGRSAQTIVDTQRTRLGFRLPPPGLLAWLGVGGGERGGALR